jgi:hypothetical protein
VREAGCSRFESLFYYECIGERYQSAVDVWAVGCVMVDALNLVAELVPRPSQRKYAFSVEQRECSWTGCYFSGRADPCFKAVAAGAS